MGCAVERAVCSICGQDIHTCPHEKGEEYGGQQCWADLVGATDAYEWSFVAVPAQREAGVVKRFGPGGGDGLALLRKQAALGQKYLRELRAEVVRLAMLADDGLDGEVFAGAVGRLEERELLELKRAYGARAAKRFPAPVQLRRRGTDRPADETAFLV